MSGPAARGGQVQLPGGGQVQWGGGSGPAAGGESGPAGGGQVQLPGGVRSSCRRGGSGPAGGGVSILCPLAGGMPLAFTQEDFLVSVFFLVTNV